jgi:dihydrofolate reductase
MIAAIAAMAMPSRTIGDGGNIPWKHDLDMAYFKATTMGHPIIMGWSTWESMGCRPLPGRASIVCSRSRTAVSTSGNGQVTTARTLDQAIRLAHDAAVPHAHEPFIIGGAALYAAAMQADIIDIWHLSYLAIDVIGDTCMPDLAMVETWPSRIAWDDGKSHGRVFDRRSLAVPS